MYDLVEKENLGPILAIMQNRSGWIIEFAPTTTHRSRRLRTEKGRLKVSWEREGLLRQRQTLLTERLDYSFDLDPRNGLAEFRRWDLQADDEQATPWEDYLRVEARRLARQRADRAKHGGWITADGKIRTG